MQVTFILFPQDEYFGIPESLTFCLVSKVHKWMTSASYSAKAKLDNVCLEYTDLQFNRTCRYDFVMFCYCHGVLRGDEPTACIDSVVF